MNDRIDTPTDLVLRSTSWTGRDVRRLLTEFRAIEDDIAEYVVLVSADGLDVRSPVVTLRSDQ